MRAKKGAVRPLLSVESKSYEKKTEWYRKWVNVLFFLIQSAPRPFLEVIAERAWLYKGEAGSQRPMA